MPTLAELTDTYVAGAAQLRQAVAGMTHDQLVARPVAGKWSTLEVVAHLADFEPVLSDRIKRIIALDKPLLFGADPEAFVKHLAYGQRDVGEELAVVEAVRTATARVLRHTPEAALQRTGVHSERGLLTLEQLLTMAGRHIPHHIAFIAEKKKALGVG